MTTIFSDGFESGNFDAWSATENSPTIVTTPVHHDSYAMRAILDSEASVNCRANKNITSTQAVYMRCYIRMEELFTQSGIKGIGPRFFYSTGSSIAYAIADCSAGKWGIRNVVNSTSYYESGTSTINPDQWYCLEAYIQINSTTGQLKLWVDGTLKVDQTGINTGSNNVTGVSVNAYSQTAEGAQRTIYFDCAVVADAYIGPQVPSTYVLTVLSGTGGTTNPTAGTYSITAGTYQSISATPNSNYSFEHWVLDSVDIGSANPYSVLMDSDHTIQPVFTSSSEFVKSLASGAPFDVLGGAISLNVEPSLQVSDSSVGINPEASPTIAGLTISGTAPKLSSSQIMAHMQVGTGGGSGYTSTSPPAVYIVGGGATTQATATAEVNDTYGKVTSIRVTGIGSGYTSTPSVYIANPASGETASAMAIMSGPATNMYVRQIILTGGDHPGGYGYLSATVTITGSGTNAQATAVIDSTYKRIARINVDTQDQGSGYSPGTTVVTISAPNDPDTEQEKKKLATAYAAVDANGHITDIFLNGELPKGQSVARFHDVSSKFHSDWILINADGLSPIAGTNESFIVEKDLQAGGMLASQQGALILNYGFKGKPVLASPPGIYLMDSPRAYPAGETFPSSYEGGQLFSLTSQYYWMGNTYQAGNYMWHGNSQTGDWLTGNYSGKYDTLFLFQKDEHTPAHLDLGNLNTHGPIHINNLPNSQSYSSYIQFVNPTDPYLAIELWNYRSIWGKNTSDIEIDTNHNGNYTPRLLIKGNAAQGNAGITSYEPITITVATGTAPITVSSTTVCSNLNADKLDGQDGSFYQNASNINSGTVPTARLGSGSPSSSTWLRGDGSWQTLSSIPWDGGIVNNNISIVRPMTEAVLYLEYSYANSIWALRSYTNGSFYMSRNGTDRLIVNTDGQLQIPTTGSGAGLLIGGDVQLYRSTDNTLTIPDFVNITPPSGNAQLLINANNAAPIITLQRNGSDRVTISHDGSSGKINCHSGNLDLAAATNYIMMPVNIQIGGKRLYEDNTWLRSAGNLQSNGYFAVAYLNGSGDADVYYDTDGGVLATQASSAKYKTNIETLNDAAWVYSLRPVAFDWKDTEKAAKKGRQLGLIAEEVAAVYPSLAVQAGGVDTIRYTGLIVPLLTCIQQLRREVTELREQLAEHKAEREVKAA